jgi:hypothetical protein
VGTARSQGGTPCRRRARRAGPEGRSLSHRRDLLRLLERARLGVHGPEDHGAKLRARSINSVALYLSSGADAEAVVDELKRDLADVPIAIRSNRRLGRKRFRSSSRRSPSPPPPPHEPSSRSAA